MQDKTPIYMMMIVGIVALVGMIYILSGTDDTTDDRLTGNVVAEEFTPDMSPIVGKFLFAAGLATIAGYMYFKKN